jgi:hypothetical protein
MERAQREGRLDVVSDLKFYALPDLKNRLVHVSFTSGVSKHGPEKNHFLLVGSRAGENRCRDGWRWRAVGETCRYAKSHRWCCVALDRHPCHASALDRGTTFALARSRYEQSGMW